MSMVFCVCRSTSPYLIRLQVIFSFYPIPISSSSFLEIALHKAVLFSLLVPTQVMPGHGMIDAHQCSPQVQKVCTHHHFHRGLCKQI